GGKGPIEVRGARVYVVRGGGSDNVSAILERLGHRRAKDAPPEAAGGAAPPGVVVEGAALELRDALTGLSISITRLDGRVRPGERLDLRMRKVRGLLAVAGEGKGPTFGGEEVDLQTALTGMHPAGIPALRVQGGYATPLPSLALTGIAGVIAPPPSGTKA